MKNTNILTNLLNILRRRTTPAGEHARLSRLIALLCPPAIRDAVTTETHLALDQPQTYFARFANALAERGIDSASDVTPWLALVDALQRHDALVECDWKTDNHDIAHALKTLAQTHQLHLRTFDALDHPSDPAPTGSHAPAIHNLLSATHMTLAFLDIDSDSYPLVLLPTASLAEAQQLAAQSGQRLTVFSETLE